MISHLIAGPQYEGVLSLVKKFRRQNDQPFDCGPSIWMSIEPREKVYVPEWSAIWLQALNMKKEYCRENGRLRMYVLKFV